MTIKTFRIWQLTVFAWLLYNDLSEPKLSSVCIQKHTGSQSQEGLVRDLWDILKVPWDQVTTRLTELIQRRLVGKSSEGNLNRPGNDPPSPVSDEFKFPAQLCPQTLDFWGP